MNPTRHEPFPALVWTWGRNRESCLICSSATNNHCFSVTSKLLTCKVLDVCNSYLHRPKILSQIYNGLYPYFTLHPRFHHSETFTPSFSLCLFGKLARLQTNLSLVLCMAVYSPRCTISTFYLSDPNLMLFFSSQMHALFIFSACPFFSYSNTLGL
ncbi:unnamed protein product [Prunus brigantina]